MFLVWCSEREVLLVLSVPKKCSRRTETFKIVTVIVLRRVTVSANTFEFSPRQADSGLDRLVSEEARDVGFTPGIESSRL
jgi:hypothetical protein